jgi:hypothetical protein
VENVKNWVSTQIAKQGFSVTLLLIACVIFNARVEKLEAKNEQLQSDIILYLKSDRVNSEQLLRTGIQVIEQNTRTMERMEKRF